MTNEENILKAIEGLGELVAMKDSQIRSQNWTIGNKQEKIEVSEGIIEKLRAELKEKDSKIADLEERIAIMTESETSEESTDFPYIGTDQKEKYLLIRQSELDGRSFEDAVNVIKEGIVRMYGLEEGE